MFLFSTLTKRPSYRLSSAQGSPTEKSWKLDQEKHSALSGTRSSLCGCSRHRGFWPPKHPLMHKSWGRGGRFGGKYSRNGITEMPKGEEQACDCSLRTDNDLPWVPYFHMTRALQMACGHKVSILSAVTDAEKETSLCFQPYDATIRAARTLPSVLSPSQEPALVPFARLPLKAKEPEPPLCRLLLCLHQGSHGDLALSSLKPCKCHVKSLPVHPPWLHPTLANLNCCLQAWAEISVTFRPCSRQEKSFPSYSFRLISLLSPPAFMEPQTSIIIFDIFFLYILFLYNYHIANYSIFNI